MEYLPEFALELPLACHLGTHFGGYPGSRLIVWHVHMLYRDSVHCQATRRIGTSGLAFAHWLGQTNGMTVDVRHTDSLSVKVAEEIRALLARRRVSGRELARRLDVSPNWVSLRITGAQKIDLDDLERIATALEVGVVDLFPRSRREVTVTDPFPPFVDPALSLIPRQVGPKPSVDKRPVSRSSHYVRPNEPCGNRH